LFVCKIAAFISFVIFLSKAYTYRFIAHIISASINNGVYVWHSIDQQFISKLSVEGDSIRSLLRKFWSNICCVESLYNHWPPVNPFMPKF